MLQDARLRLFLTSGTILFVELLLIRWIPANAVYVGFFNNFLLLASFLGIGIGILLGWRLEASAAAWFAPFAFALPGRALTKGYRATGRRGRHKWLQAR